MLSPKHQEKTSKNADAVNRHRLLKSLRLRNSSLSQSAWDKAESWQKSALRHALRHSIDQPSSEVMEDPAQTGSLSAPEVMDRLTNALAGSLSS